MEIHAPCTQPAAKKGRKHGKVGLASFCDARLLLSLQPPECQASLKTDLILKKIKHQF